MQRLIESLLRYAQAGHGDLKTQAVSVDSILIAVRATLAPLIEGTAAKLLSPGLPSVDADPVLLEQVFLNLVTNSLKYCLAEVPPIIEVWGEPTEEGWIFSVKDNGQGVPAAFHSMIFEPLKRLHGSSTPGTGLGLSLARTVVERHGGRIWVESDGLKKGATFRFTLPQAARELLAVGLGQ